MFIKFNFYGFCAFGIYFKPQISFFYALYRFKMLPAYWDVPKWRKMWSHLKWKWRVQVSDGKTPREREKSDVPDVTLQNIPTRSYYCCVCISLNLCGLWKGILVGKKRGRRFPPFHSSLWMGAVPSNRRGPSQKFCSIPVFLIQFFFFLHCPLHTFILSKNEKNLGKVKKSKERRPTMLRMRRTKAVHHSPPPSTAAH